MTFDEWMKGTDDYTIRQKAIAKAAWDAAIHGYLESCIKVKNNMTKEKRIEQLRLAAEILEKDLEWEWRRHDDPIDAWITIKNNGCKVEIGTTAEIRIKPNHRPLDPQPLEYDGMYMWTDKVKDKRYAWGAIQNPQKPPGVEFVDGVWVHTPPPPKIVPSTPETQPKENIILRKKADHKIYGIYSPLFFQDYECKLNEWEWSRSLDGPWQPCGTWEESK